MNNRQKQSVRAERKQQKLEAGFMSSLFPEVASINISMVYNQKGIKQSMPRTVNFFPASYAFFRVDCLSKECVEGGFDFTDIISSMVRSRKVSANGELGCGGGPVEDHSAIVYEVAIQYV
jgi:hypothetical protein